jgi:aryl-alcohol dehydrogenase-like predicted oxidoreductase
MSYGDPKSTSAHLWSLDDEDAQPFFCQAVELGVTFWDIANVYQHGTSEELVGRAIKRYARREEIVLATKVHGKMHDGPGGQGLSRKAILEQVDASLARLGTDDIDLYQIHRFDPDARVEETMEALHDIVKAGKVRYLGASSMHAWQFAKLQHAADRHGWTRFVSMQNQDNLLRRQDERELLAMCADMGGASCLLPAGQGPPGSSLGRAAPPLQRGQDRQGLRLTAGRAGRQRGPAHRPSPRASMAQVAVAWVLQHPVVSAPIVGATKPHHLPEAITALARHLTDDEIHALEAPYTPHGPARY